MVLFAISRRLSVPCALGIALATLLPQDSAAKVIPGSDGIPLQTKRTAVTAGYVREFESRTRPFFEARAREEGISAPSRATGSIRESDLLMIPRLWNRLSPSFKALYAQAVDIPDKYVMHISPGGHFELYYTTTDPSEGVDTTDTIGYGNGQGWRTRTSGSNGIPDYIDEVAWACDSSWSLHVERSGLNPPIPYKPPGHPSDRYKVVVTLLGARDYGYTFAVGRGIDASKGYASIFQLRNHWNGDLWESFGYDKRPQDGIRVTCAHELFHAVQYAMTWNTLFGDDLDDFPLGFIEGTAVLMEEIAFDYVNDYLQYATAFFSDPRMSFFDASGGLRAYSNSLLTKYLYEKLSQPPGIGLFKQMMVTNYAAVTPFDENLRAAALTSGMPWTLMLNRFHTGSYYTGVRADTARFLADASLFSQWSYPADTLPASRSVSKTVGPYAMQTMAFTVDSLDGDTLHAGFEGAAGTGSALPPPSWAVSCILTSPSRPDSMVPIPIDQTNRGWCRIDRWRSWRELLVLVTNGHPSQTRSATLSLLPCPVTYPAGKTATVSSDAPDGGSSLSITLSTTEDLRCSLEVRSIAEPPPAIPSTLLRLSSLWSVSYPAFWGSGASLSGTISVLSRRIDSLKNSWLIRDDSIAAYAWNTSSALWEQQRSQLTVTAGAFVCSTENVQSRIYGVFASLPSSPDTTAALAISNLGRLSANKYVEFQARDITGIRIYGGDGTLVCATGTGSLAFQKYAGGYRWRLANNHGRNVVPGFYTALITRRNTTQSTLRKIMVFP
ncbi:MAG: hypothetical protein JXA71_07290 [Chitinispirillaceae bacterium]|nr:hypothetical protein [Chitinispirillaceae bacterium]